METRLRHGGAIIALPAAQAVKLPDKISFEAGACLGIPAMTAIHAIALAGAEKGTAVLVSGGAGSVGQYAIQFAKALGASVLTTISSPEKAAVAREAGADHAIDYKREDVGERVMEITGKRGVDAVIEMDITANAKHIPSCCGRKGSVIVYGTGAPTASIPSAFCRPVDPPAIMSGLRTGYPRTRAGVTGDHARALNKAN